MRRFLITFLSAVLLVGGVVLAAPAFAAAPTITSFSPTSGPLGTTVTLLGTGFVASGTTIDFGGVAATKFTVASTTKITVAVPSTAPSGSITVTTSGGTATSSGPFTVTPGVKLSATFAPPTGTTIASWSGLGAYEAVDVYLDTTAVALVSNDINGTGHVTVTIPSTTTPGIHWISAIGRHSGISAQASLTVRTNWAQIGYDASGRGYNPYENVLSTAVVSNGLDEAWRAGPGDASDYAGGPVVSNGLVFDTFGDDTVRAFNETTGAQVWSKSVTYASEAQLSTAAGVVYYAGGKTLYAFNSTTGAQLWSTGLLDFSTGAPLVTGSTIWLADNSNHLEAFSTAGTALEYIDFSPNQILRLAAYGDTLVVGLANGYIYAYPSTPNEPYKWYQSIPGFIEGLTIGNGVLYASNNDQQLSAFRIDTGALLWTDTLASEASRSAFAKGVLYVGEANGTVISLTGSTGATRWTSSVPGGVAVYAQPAYADGVLYISDATGLVAFNASTGANLWSANETNQYNGPAVVDGTVFVGTTNDRVVAYTPTGVAPQVTRPDPRTLHRQRSSSPRDVTGRHHVVTQ